MFTLWREDLSTTTAFTELLINAKESKYRKLEALHKVATNDARWINAQKLLVRMLHERKKKKIKKYLIDWFANSTTKATANMIIKGNLLVRLMRNAQLVTCVSSICARTLILY